ncbi:MAG: sodium:proton antiporter [Candidatus Zixiibacteriota bacterium]|nr:MAG: sodium:proton antiporter [candidate division Zixibacteria bacterium]
MKRHPILLLLLPALLYLCLAAAGTAASETEPPHLVPPEVQHDIGAELPVWTALPFAGILLSIALLPLFAPVFWHHHFGKVSLAWSVIFAAPFLWVYHGEALHAILHIYLIDYIPFIILLGGLFTVSGGIYLRGSLAGTPAVNTVLLLIGTFLASLIGTTGASMLLIRPVIRANKGRQNKMHIIIFFIFLVSNIGGSLTPLGDPPLFLGFLHGVPFFWTLNLFPLMGFAAALLLILLFLVDTWLYRREGSPKLDTGTREPLRLEGSHNFLFLGGIIAAVLFSGLYDAGEYTLLGIHMAWQDLARDLIILLMGYLSLKTTRTQIRRDNGFTWFPIQEVAILFFGIFMTIIPALAILRAGEHGSLAGLVKAVQEPRAFFWVTGGLSSFLDNAPTYLTFFNLALGRLGLTELQAAEILRGAVQHASGEQFVSLLLAISAGAVFMGANSYIGNAPNFMVRSIAEENKIQMPSFFGYMIWSLGILIPLFLLITVIFF